MVTWVTWVCELCGSHVYVGCVGTWVKTFFTWVIILRGSYFYVGRTFLRGSKIFCVGHFVGQNFLRGSNNFYLGQLLEVGPKRNLERIIVPWRTLNQDPISCNPSFTRILALVFQYFSMVFASTLCLSIKAASESKLKQGISRFTAPAPLGSQR